MLSAEDPNGLLLHVVLRCCHRFHVVIVITHRCKYMHRDSHNPTWTQAESLQPCQLQVHFILPATENMVDGNATRPSDIVSASNGKTVEVRTPMRLHFGSNTGIQQLLVASTPNTCHN